MKINVSIVRGDKLVSVGYIEAESFNADKCYDCFNWERWTKNKPENLHANVSSSNRVCFTNPDTNEMWLTKSIGWLSGGEEVINEYIKENAGKLLWW